jgi:hypothetical protein
MFALILLLSLSSHAADQAQVCNVGSVCAAAYSGNGEGCCPYTDAVCCPNKQTCCPKGTTCQDSGTYKTTCVGASANETVGLSVCKSGAAKPLSTTLKNVLIIGDSVSIGYTPYVAQHMATVADVQHSPYDHSDGGAEETAYGVQCLDYLLTSPGGVFLKPDGTCNSHLATSPPLTSLLIHTFIPSHNV